MTTPPESGAPSQPERLGVVVWTLLGVGGIAVAVLMVLLVGLALGFGAGPAMSPQDSTLAMVGEPLDAVPGNRSTAGVDAGTNGSSAFGSDIIVDVAGAVARPGLQRLQLGDRVGDAVEAAGGFSPRVDLAEATQSLNLAEVLVDGAKVLVPELGSEPASRLAAADARIDINAASQTELESLPGVGPVTASKIIASRSKSRFATVEDLRARKLVGDAVFKQIEGLVRVVGR